MGRLPTGRRAYQLEQIWDDHKEINRRLALGQKNVDIAKEMNISPVTVSITKNSHIAQVHREELTRSMDAQAIDVGVEIRNLAPIALERLKDVMLGEDTQRSLSAKIAMDLLDRAGYGAVQKTQAVTCTISSEQLEELKKRGRECGIIKIQRDEVPVAIEPETSNV